MKTLNALTAAALLTCSSLSLAAEPASNAPYKFIDMPVNEAASKIGTAPNEANNLVVSEAGRRVLLESEGNTIELVDIELRDQPLCKQNSAFDGNTILKSMSINPGDLELAINNTDNQTYYDHNRKLKIGIQCAYDGAPLNVTFSRKHYMVLMGMTQP